MKRHRFGVVRPRGYTIIEVMIVLAVTGALFVSAAVLIAGRQQRTQFEQAIREVHSQIQQVETEVRHGYFPSRGNFNCTVTGGGSPSFSAVAAGQGTNEGCIFLGKAIQFQVQGTDPEEFRVMTIAGRQQTTDGQPVSSLDEAQPRVIAPSDGDGSTPGGGGPGGEGSGCPWWWPPCWWGSGTLHAQAVPDASVNESLLYGLTTAWADAGAVALVSNLSGAAGTGAGSVRQLDLISVDNTTLGMTEEAAAEALDTNLTTSPANPGDGVRVCFVSGGTDQSGLITIGGSGRGLSVTLDIWSDRTCGQ